MQYRREIDGLRALAVVPVIFFHAGFQAFGGGFVGVDIFFVISGYLITSILLEEKHAGTFSLIKFYERRARRILPALFLVMFVCLPFAWCWLLTDDLKDFSQSLVAVPAFSSNILFWMESGYFDAAAELKPLLHTWSLAVEEQYYVLFPIFLLLTWRFGQRWIVGILAMVALASLGLAQWGSYAKPEFTFFLLPTRAWEILVGAFVAFYLFTKKDDRPESTVARQSLSIIGLLLITYAVGFFDNQTPFPGLYALVPTIGAALVILFSGPRTLVGRLLGSKVLVGLGLISYSAYLWHQPLFVFARHRSVEEPDKILFAVLAVIAVLLAYCSWRFVETPFRNRQRIKRNQVFAFGAICSAVFVAIGLAGHFSGGFPGRYGANDENIAFPLASRYPYVFDRINKLYLKPFDKTDRPKILIIGDSFAGDLVNALFESGSADSVQISAYNISGRCGNLYLKEEFISKIKPKDRAGCIKANWYGNSQLTDLMKQADIVLLASYWSYWVAELLPRSIQNLQQDYGNKFVVIGGKHLQRVSLLNLLGFTPEQRKKMKFKISDEQIKTNLLMTNTLSAESFVNVSLLLCGSETVCRNFTDEGRLMFFDGAHVTVEGAKFYGEQLVRSPPMQFLTKKSDMRF